jgi:hypothetical protein
MVPLCVQPFTLLVELASSTSGDMLSLRCAYHHPIKIGDERERQVTARDGKELNPSWGKLFPGVQPREFFFAGT